MENNNLPVFKYHPDPIKTGSIKYSEKKCEACNKSRGFLYSGPIYCASEIADICPWCIKDGTSQKIAVSFVGDIAGNCPQNVKEEVEFRTPGFSTWQEPIWLTCCNDACSFLGGLNYKEVEHYPGIFDSIKENIGLSEKDWEAFFQSLKLNTHPIYTFKCLSCGRYHAYSDFT